MQEIDPKPNDLYMKKNEVRTYIFHKLLSKNGNIYAVSDFYYYYLFHGRKFHIGYDYNRST